MVIMARGGVKRRLDVSVRVDIGLRTVEPIPWLLLLAVEAKRVEWRETAPEPPTTTTTTEQVVRAARLIPSSAPADPVTLPTAQREASSDEGSRDRDDAEEGQRDVRRRDVTTFALDPRVRPVGVVISDVVTAVGNKEPKPSGSSDRDVHGLGCARSVHDARVVDLEGVRVDAEDNGAVGVDFVVDPD
jgi:hypothetical protein